jgi:ABC-2 type transport system ATP-binding protein
MMGIVPQDWIFLWDCSVYHNLRFFGKLRGLTSKAAISRAHELIDELDMSGYQGRHFSTLSGGQRQRVLLAIASLVPSSLLVLDEPTTGLDPEVRHQVWNYIRRRKTQGSSMLITTHNMEEAETLCDRVGILHNGSMKALDTIAGLRSLHAGEFKVTYFLDGTDLGQSKTIYGNDDRDLVAQVQALGVKEFTVSKTTLEDVYLTVVRGNNRTS